jgi:tetratricopeptide (TPR) repeat protein
MMTIPLFQASPALSDQIVINSDDQFQFAQDLMEGGKYQRAVAEFERFIHFFPKDEKVPKARYLIGLCHLESMAYESARRVLEEVKKDYSHTPLGGEALFFIGESYYRQGVFGEAAYYFQMLIDRHPQPEIRNAGLYRLAWSRMQLGKWQEASDTFKMVERGTRLYSRSLGLSQRSLEGEVLPYKDPAAAGVMAAIIPGLGHAYTNRYKDATVAFLLNGLIIWAAIESFDRDHDVLGGILTFVGLGFYTGNIYSAVNTTHKYNRKVKDDFLRGLNDKVDINLFTSKKGHLGLALTIYF